MLSNFCQCSVVLVTLLSVRQKFVNLGKLAFGECCIRTLFEFFDCNFWRVYAGDAIAQCRPFRCFSTQKFIQLGKSCARLAVLELPRNGIDQISRLPIGAVKVDIWLSVCTFGALLDLSGQDFQRYNYWIDCFRMWIGNEAALKLANPTCFPAGAVGVFS